MFIEGVYNNAEVIGVTPDLTTTEQIKTFVNTEQFSNCNIKIMPDCHAGKGCCIGYTQTLNDYIIPNLIGVDIGCGMSMGILPIKDIDLEQLDTIIKKTIPSGFNVRDKEVEYVSEFKKDIQVLCNRIKSDKETFYMCSLGTLGGGNHFIEAGKSKDGNVCLTIHSGSRNLGNNVAKFYQEKAALLNGGVKDLEYFTKDNKEYFEYIDSMKICTRYAELNRVVILLEIIKKLDIKQEDVKYINCIHNYIGDDNIIRKGAISAYAGEDVIIPFNMRDGLILGKGLGNKEWNYSAPHGAGRILSRGQAKRSIKLEDFKQTMSGIYTTCVCEDTLDESPMVYKDTQIILNAIKPTVDVVDFIKPIYNFKSSK
jgi:tRNA-splicing ligase RtcB (3'-phosphate/5'-hydroxy nucleic acid ligase)